MLSVISDAMDTFIQNALTGNTMQVAWEDVAFDPQTGQPYLDMQLSGYTRTNTGPGPQTVFVERGSHTITVVWPAGAGKAAALGEADKIHALFPRGLTIALAGQAPLIIDQSSVVSPAISDGSWLRVPVNIYWSTSEFGP